MKYEFYRISYLFQDEDTVDKLEVKECTEKEAQDYVKELERKDNSIMPHDYGYKKIESEVEQ